MKRVIVDVLSLLEVKNFVIKKFEVIIVVMRIGLRIKKIGVIIINIMVVLVSVKLVRIIRGMVDILVVLVSGIFFVKKKCI